jgi:Protein of unknown function (DUF4199)
MEKKQMSHVVAGLLIAALIVLFAIITNFLGAAQQSSLGFIQYLIIIGGLVFFIYQYGRANHFTKGFGDLFAYGFKATAVYTLIFVVFIVLFFLLFPDMKEKSLEAARQQMETNNKLTDDQIDQAMKISRKFFWIGVVGGSIFVLIVIGAIGSLVGAAVTKKRPYNPLEQLNA